MRRVGGLVIFWLIRWAAVVLAAPASQPLAASRPTTGPVSIAALRKVAEGTKVPEALAALRQLSAAGDEAGVRMAAPLILARDAAAIKEEAATAGASLAKLRAAEKERASLQAAALGAIAKLTKTPEALAAARDKYDRLAALRGRVAAEYPRQIRLAEVVGRRAECLTLWRATDRAAPAADSPSVMAEDARLAKWVEAAVGMPAGAVSELAAGPLQPPAEVGHRGLWLYAASRRIDAYNRTLDAAMNAGEIAHLKRVNDYRELLGLLPYEVDVRLIQSARRHSKEMFDLKYFSHWSPTPGLQTLWHRMAQAGYPYGSTENITLGGWTGDEAFWYLFSSPPHHRAWIKPEETAIGVGKWENAWTENMGILPRLMTASEAERARAKVSGEPLAPQWTEATRKSPRDLREYKFYDMAGNETTPRAFLPGPGNPGGDGREIKVVK